MLRAQFVEAHGGYHVAHPSIVLPSIFNVAVLENKARFIITMYFGSRNIYI